MLLQEAEIFEDSNASKSLDVPVVRSESALNRQFPSPKNYCLFG